MRKNGIKRNLRVNLNSVFQVIQKLQAPKEHLVSGQRFVVQHQGYRPVNLKPVYISHRLTLH